MTKEELNKMHSVQKEWLHDAATTLELDPDDEVMFQDDFTLSFSSYDQAKKVARLAAKNYNNDGETKCFPAVVHYAGKGRVGYLATLDFEEEPII